MCYNMLKSYISKHILQEVLFMASINDNYLKLPGSYLFAEIGRRVAAFKEAHPEADIIRLGIGDVTQPLPAACSRR